MNDLFGLISVEKDEVEISIISLETMEADLATILSKQIFDNFEDTYFLGTCDDNRIEKINKLKFFRISYEKRSEKSILCKGMLYVKSQPMACDFYIDLNQYYNHTILCYEKEMKNILRKVNTRKIRGIVNVLHKVKKNTSQSYYDPIWNYQLLNKGNGNCIYIPPLFLWNVGLERMPNAEDCKILTNASYIFLSNWQRNNICGIQYASKIDFFNKIWIVPEINRYHRLAFLAGHNLMTTKNYPIVLHGEDTLVYQDGRIVIYKIKNENIALVLKQSHEKVLLCDCFPEEASFLKDEPYEKILFSKISSSNHLFSQSILMDRRSKNLKL